MNKYLHGIKHEFGGSKSKINSKTMIIFERDLVAIHFIMC